MNESSQPETIDLPPPTKVLVLGAGASCAYGYPSGRELRHAIVTMSPRYAQAAGIIGGAQPLHDMQTFENFRREFDLSQMYSIDAFLGIRREHAEIGKKAIAAILLEREVQGKLFSEAPEKDHWYQYFWNQYSGLDWGDLRFDELAIVTFNYDRSLEHYFQETLQRAHGKSTDEAVEKMKSLRVLHVYGSLCDKLPNDGRYLHYDGQVDPSKVERAAAGLVVIPEGRIDSPTLVKARAWLRYARSICFLGFGFDRLNVQRLAAGDVCSKWKQLAGGNTMRMIVGTCMGMTNAEISEAYGTLALVNLNDTGRSDFMPTTCTQLLREKLFLR